MEMLGIVRKIRDINACARRQKPIHSAHEQRRVLEGFSSAAGKSCAFRARSHMVKQGLSPSPSGL